MPDMKTLDLQKIVDKWQDKEGSIIMILHEIQSTVGYVPREISLELSKKMNLPLAKIYEVLSFYHFFKLTPPAKHQISVCTGTACYLKGAQSVIEELEKELGLKSGGQTADGRFSVSAVRCIGCCALAPAMSVDGKIHGKVKPADIASIIREVTKGEEQHA